MTDNTYMGHMWGFKHVRINKDGEIVPYVARTRDDGGNMWGSHAFRHIPRIAYDAEPIQAVCGRFGDAKVGAINNNPFRSAPDFFTEDNPHGISPQEGCGCGFYGWNSLSDLYSNNTIVSQTVSVVKDKDGYRHLNFDVAKWKVCDVMCSQPTIRFRAWGKIIQHELGFRSQFMQIDSLYLYDVPPDDSIITKIRNRTFDWTGIDSFEVPTISKANFNCWRAFKDQFPIIFTKSALGEKPTVEVLADYWRTQEKGEHTLSASAVKIPASEILTEDFVSYGGQANINPRSEGGT